MRSKRSYFWCEADKLQPVQSLCQGNSTCNFKANEKALGNVACAHPLRLEIDYHCHSCDNNNNYRSKRGGLGVDVVSLCLSLRDETLRSLKDRCNKHMSDSDEPFCPSIEFVDKHMNTHVPGNTDEAATLFAERVARIRSRSHTSQTSKHTVFDSHPGATYRQENCRCIFLSPKPKYDCTRNTSGKWSCRYMGMVYATHDLHTGHYFHEMDVFMNTNY